MAGVTRLKFAGRDELAGTSCVLLFVCTWLASMLSPVLLLTSFALRESLPLGWLWWKMLAALAALAYAPEACFGAGVEVEGSLRQRINAFVSTGFIKYFEGVQIVYEEPPPAGDTAPTLFCVHPHGIFARTSRGIARPPARGARTRGSDRRPRALRICPTQWAGRCSTCVRSSDACASASRRRSRTPRTSACCAG